MLTVAELVLKRTAALPVSRNQVRRLILDCKRIKREEGMRGVILFLAEFVESFSLTSAHS